eukprot:TRINITY_DN824_c0_g6_i2.p1 TRINITY_DN824_c0_g6~~TRINITY_DN824_c0_g6_i2.p1  ORF type:complete len:614 (-),score=123.01 TRINITY_DN824_c0_g6_i2:218-2059(-)
MVHRLPSMSAPTRCPGFKPIAITDETTPHATIAGLLQSLNTNFAELLQGQQEMCDILALLCQDRGAAAVVNGKVDAVALLGGSATKQRVSGKRQNSGFRGGDSRAAVKDQAQANGAAEMPRAFSSHSFQSEGKMPWDCEMQDVDAVAASASEPQTPGGGRSSFNQLRTADEDVQELCNLITMAEEHKRARKRRRSCWERLGNLSHNEWELFLDFIIGFAVCANATVIAYSYDAPPEHENALFITDVVFSTLFAVELIVKLSMKGCKGQFCGEGWKMNSFDALLIVVDVSQLIVLQALKRMQGTSLELPSVSVFRILRLVRLTRLLRLLRYHIFDDMITMVGGMVGGMSTLFWAMLVYGFVIFVIALIFRETLGNYEAENVYEYFDSVPRSMFTVFRCSFGECDALPGVPIIEHVILHYGTAASFAYFIFIFVMTIGLFNVISAVFIEATMAAAAAMRYSQKKARLKDLTLFSTRIFTILKALIDYSNIDLPPDASLVEVVGFLYALDVKADVLQEIAKDEEVSVALEELEVDPEDHDHLSVILDPDQNGSITVIELIEGIKHLRGEPKRSDIVQLDLMLRSVMGVVKEILVNVKASPQPSPQSSWQLSKTSLQ